MCHLKLDLTVQCICATCDEDYNLVCGSDGLTYASACYAKQLSCTEKRDIQTTEIQTCSKLFLVYPI